MNIYEAVLTGKEFKRPSTDWMGDPNYTAYILTLEDLKAIDWEIKKEEK